VHPYRKWWGTHRRLVELADLEPQASVTSLRPGVDQELGRLTPNLDGDSVTVVRGLVRRHATIEGNAVYALSRLGFAGDAGTRRPAQALMDWQWPDGGWNCDRREAAHRSSFRSR
jgi:hypothetical protein